MKRALIIIVALLQFSSPAFCANQWTPTLSGSSQAADIDTNVSTSWSAQDRLFLGYRSGCQVIPDSASTIKVNVGEIAIPNSDESIVRYRRITSAISVTWSDIDTGVEANATQYYVYALADSDATTFTVKISTSSTAPSGATYYRKIGYFYNNSSGDIESVGSVKTGSVQNIVTKTSSTQFSTTSTTGTDDTEASIRFYSSGGPITISYGVAGEASGIDDNLNIMLSIDGADLAASTRWQVTNGTTSSNLNGNITTTVIQHDPGFVTIQGRVFVSSGTGYINYRTLTASEG